MIYLFTRYHGGVSAAPPNPIDLQTAAERLGVHYQTAYQWVRSGRLRAQRIRGRYQLDPDDVERLARQRSEPTPRPTRRPRGGFENLAQRAYHALVDGDERSLRDLVDRLTSDGMPMTTITQEILAPAMRRIGTDWHDQVVTISDEHRASAIVDRILGDHYPNPRGRRRGTVVVAALSGERHALPTSMAALALREDSWRVQHLGAIYYAQPDGSSIREVIFPSESPNGIGLSPDGTRLYAAETHSGRVYAWNVVAPGQVEQNALGAAGGLLCGLPGMQLFDSLGVDSDGNVVVATLVTGALTVINPAGEVLDQALTGDPMTTNVCWGGDDLRTAYVTCSGTGRLVSMPWPRPGLELNY